MVIKILKHKQKQTIEKLNSNINKLSYDIQEGMRFVDFNVSLLNPKSIIE